MTPTAAIRALAPLALALAAIAGEPAQTITFAADGQPARAVLATVHDLTGVDHELDQDALVAGDLARPITIALVDATPAAVRQALAHALGDWWSLDGARVVLARGGRAAGTPAAKLYSSTALDDRALEQAARRLLAPWLGDRDAGLAYVGEEGRWYATLAPSGQQRLLEVLALGERGVGSCPPLLADPETPDPRRRLTRPVAARGWRAVARALADAAGISVALGPGLGEDVVERTVPAATLGELPDRLRALGAEAAIIHGVLCLDREPPADREQPWARARLALLPIRHLVRDEVDGEVLAAAITTRVCPAAWNQPGWGVFHLPTPRALLVAGDARALTAVLDALAQVDLLGIDDGLAALGTPAGGRR